MPVTLLFALLAFFIAIFYQTIFITKMHLFSPLDRFCER